MQVINMKGPHQLQGPVETDRIVISVPNLHKDCARRQVLCYFHQQGSETRLEHTQTFKPILVLTDSYSHTARCRHFALPS